MKRIFIPILSLVLLGTALTFSSCLKKDYDAPPDESNYDPNLAVTTTIAQLVAMPQAEITGDIIISGVVSMNDKSGNYYKKMVIQDSTGGIEVHIDQANLYTDYPVGRKVYIKCKGLYLGSYHALPQLGSTPDGTGAITNINATTVSDYIVKATFPNNIKVDTLNYADLGDPATVANRKRLNTLVAIRDVQFTDADAGAVWAPPSTSQSRGLTTCNPSGKAIIVRTSNYANFQPILTPTGQGYIVGIYTGYDAAAQLVIRDTSDVHFNNPRCGAGGTPPPVDTSAPLITIDSARKIFKGDSLTLGSYRIQGVVISDKSFSNFPNANVIIQQGTSGILVRYDGTHSLNKGDLVNVTITGASMVLYGGLLEVLHIPTSSTTKIGSGTITPRTATVAQISANYQSYESTLVTILNLTFPSGTYSGNKVLSDGTGSITLYTQTYATFSATAMPTGAKTVTGIAGQFNGTKQLQINNPATDIQ
jgi:hypothetical protein